MLEGAPQARGGRARRRRRLERDPTEIARRSPCARSRRDRPGAMPGDCDTRAASPRRTPTIYLNEINKAPRKTRTRLTFA